jgi:hypothetical protein
MKFTVKWPSLLIRITLSLKNPTMISQAYFCFPKHCPSEPQLLMHATTTSVSRSLHVGWGGRTNTTASIILATTAMGRDCGSDVERHITRQLLRIILTPDQFERKTGHQSEGAPAVACRNSSQGGSFRSPGRASSNRRMAATMATTMKMTVTGEGGETEKTMTEAM